jgi:hypothetical protein
VGIDSVNFTKYNFDIPGIFEDVPNRLSDIGRRKPSRRDLIEPRLEQVMIGSID